MDSEELRWTLLIIGAVLIVAVYMYGRHQNKLRNRAAIKTYTQDELDDPYIDDDTLRQELKNLDEVLSDDEQEHYQKININPGIEAEYSSNLDDELFVQERCEADQSLVTYYLQKSDGSGLLRQGVHMILLNNKFVLDPQGQYLFFEAEQELFSVALESSDDDNLEEIQALRFYMDKKVHCKNADQSYEKMLKVIDQLTLDLKVKVYNQNHCLLTIDDISIIRKKLLKIND